MKIIDNISKNFDLNESSHGVIEEKFAIINLETGETITPFCKCKDYFSDLFWSKVVEQDFSIYGFNWKNGQDNGVLNKEKLGVAIQFYDRLKSKVNNVSENQLNSIITLLNKFEKANGFELSKGEICEDYKHIIVTFSRQWLVAPYVLSSFFLLSRLGPNYVSGSLYEAFNNPTMFISPHDEMYIKNSRELLEDLENGIIDESQKWTNYKTSSDVHSSSGIQGYSSKKKRDKSILEKKEKQIAAVVV